MPVESNSIKTREIEIQVDQSEENTRLDIALSHHPEIRTRSRAAKLILLGKVSLNGKSSKASSKLKSGDIIRVEIPLETKVGIAPLYVSLDIYHEDDSVIVVNKPAGLVVHPAAGHAQDTLVNMLVAHTTELSLGFGEQRPGIVHRLDKDTSGLIVIAKNNLAQERLSLQFRKRTTHRIYYAVVFGALKKKLGRIEGNLKRHPSNRKKFASCVVGGRFAVTRFKVIAEHPTGVSLVKVKLETGRTHQIRVHLSELGHPIVGDSLYGGDKRIRSIEKLAVRTIVQSMKRFALHAAELGFRHPTTHKKRLFFADWPEDLKSLIHELGWDELVKNPKAP